IWQVGYAAAKAADPSAIVASPGIYVFDGQWQDGVGHGDGLRFLDEALAARPALWFSFDALAIHPYLPDVAPDQPGLYASISFWGRMSTARSWLSERTARYGGAPKPLWISEVGWSTCTAAQADCYTRAAVGAAGAAQAPAVFLGPMAMGTPPATTQVAALPNALIGKSEAQQADYLVRAYALAMAIGVQHLSWFQLEDKFDGAAHNFWEEAAIFGTVAEGYRAKPAAQAYATLSGLLAGGRFTGFGALNTFSYTPNVLSPQARFHLRFVSADNRQIDLLWRNAGAEVVDLPLEPGRGAELRDRAGSVLGLTLIGGAARLTVGESPLYLIQSLSPGLQVIPSGVYALMQPDEPPTQLTITVANSGSGAISWSATSNAAWLSVQTPAGQGYASPLTFSIDPSGLGLGSHSATLRVSSGALAQDVPITLMIIEQVWRQRLPFVAR
ncbi:MAG: BACON domain-containing protein, partial [Oscillochloris sp.]|nr:BACON domain-containing protein [Oscillochloris sp.]